MVESGSYSAARGASESTREYITRRREDVLRTGTGCRYNTIINIVFFVRKDGGQF